MAPGASSVSCTRINYFIFSSSLIAGKELVEHHGWALVTGVEQNRANRRRAKLRHHPLHFRGAAPPFLPSSHPHLTPDSTLDWVLYDWKDGNNFQDILDAGNRYADSKWGAVCCIWPELTVVRDCTARELTLEAAQSAAINRSSSTDYASKTYTPAHIKKLLDSRHEREVLDGMRRVISVRPRSSTIKVAMADPIRNS